MTKAVLASYVKGRISAVLSPRPSSLILSSAARTRRGCATPRRAGNDLIVGPALTAQMAITLPGDGASIHVGSDRPGKSEESGQQR